MNITTPPSKWLLLCSAALGLALPTTALRAETLLEQNFDTTGVGLTPSGWTTSKPEGTTAQTTSTVSASAPNSFELNKDKSALIGLPSSPSLSATFKKTSSGVVTLTADVQVTSTKNDLLYIKVRNDRGGELGGVRLHNGTFGSIEAEGTYLPSSVTYTPNHWITVRIVCDLSAQSYTVKCDDLTVIEDAPFRSIIKKEACNAASVVFQAAVNTKGSGQSAYIDNVKADSSESATH